MNTNEKLIREVQRNGPFNRSRPPVLDSPRGSIDTGGLKDWEMRPGPSDSLDDLIRGGLIPTVPISADDDMDTDEDNLLAAPPQDKPQTSLDTWAFYKPFHFYTKNWGVYILESGLLELARRIQARVGTNSTKSLLAPTAAYRALLEHELFHHYVEVACSRAQYVGTLGGAAPIYPYYFDDHHGWAVEEAMANAAAVRRSSKVLLDRFATNPSTISIIKSVKDELGSHTPPYGKYQTFLADRNFAIGKNELLQRMLSLFAAKNAGFRASFVHPLSQTHFFGLLSPEATKCPIYLIMDVGKMKTCRFMPADFGLQVAVYSNDHKPEHIHVKDLQAKNNAPKEARYLWSNVAEGSPVDAIYPRDVPLQSRRNKKLAEYIRKYREKIDAKVKAVDFQ